MKRTGIVTAALVVGLTLMGAAPAQAAAGAIPAHGCEANGKVLPGSAHDVITQKIGDVDLDGRADTLFHYTSPNTWGVKTASGAVMVERDLPLGAVDDQHAWAFQPEVGPAVMVVDDSKSALPYYLVHTASGCHFRTPTNSSGGQYTFALFGSGHTRYGSGVGCLGSDKGGYNLYGRNAVKLASGRYRIDDTLVSTRDGKVVKAYGTHNNGKTYDVNDGHVTRAQLSICPRTPTLVVSNGGR